MGTNPRLMTSTVDPSLPLLAGVSTRSRSTCIPVLLGNGHRLFDVLPWAIELEVIRVLDTASAAHVRHRVLT